MLTLQSNQISTERLEKLRKEMPKAKIIVHDVGSMPLELFEPVHKMQ